MHTPIRLVADTGGLSTAAVRALHRRHDVDAGVIVVTLRPATRRIGWVAHDVLAALGKTNLHAGTGRSSDRDWALVPVWLAAHRITDVVLCDTDHLPDDVAGHLLRGLTGARARVWVVAGGSVGEPTAAALANWPVAHATLDELHAALPQPTGGDTPAAADDTVPWPASVPDADFCVFRAACRDTLPAEAFATVDARYRDTHARAGTRLDADGVTDHTVRGLLADEIAAAATQAELTTRVRAVQAAAFTRGGLLAVDLYELLAAQPAAPRQAAADPATWRRLRAYRPPHRPVICALTAAGLAIDDLRAATVADAHPDGSRLATADGGVALPEGSAPFLRAQRLHRLLSGAEPDDPLLASPTGEPLGERAVAATLGDAMRELGIPLLNGQAIRRRPGDSRWLAGRGFALTPLHTGRQATR